MRKKFIPEELVNFFFFYFFGIKDESNYNTRIIFISHFNIGHYFSRNESRQLIVTK